MEIEFLRSNDGFNQLFEHIMLEINTFLQKFRYFNGYIIIFHGQITMKERGMYSGIIPEIQGKAEQIPKQQSGICGNFQEIPKEIR